MQACGIWLPPALADGVAARPVPCAQQAPFWGDAGDTRTDAESFYLSAAASEPAALHHAPAGHFASQAALPALLQPVANAPPGLTSRADAQRRGGRLSGIQPVKLQRLNPARSGERSNVWSSHTAAVTAMPGAPPSRHGSSALTAAPPPRFPAPSGDGKTRSVANSSGKARASASSLLQDVLPYAVTPHESAASDATTVVPEPTVADNPGVMVLGVRWTADGARAPPWWREGALTDTALQSLNKAEVLLKDEAPKKVDRATTRQLNDRLGIDAEARKRMQTERNRQTARAAASRRRQASDTLEDMVRRPAHAQGVDPQCAGTLRTHPVLTSHGTL